MLEIGGSLPAYLQSTGVAEPGSGHFFAEEAETPPLASKGAGSLRSTHPLLRFLPYQPFNRPDVSGVPNTDRTGRAGTITQMITSLMVKTKL